MAVTGQSSSRGRPSGMSLGPLYLFVWRVWRCVSAHRYALFIELLVRYLFPQYPSPFRSQANAVCNTCVHICEGLLACGPDHLLSVFAPIHLHAVARWLVITQVSSLIHMKLRKEKSFVISAPKLLFPSSSLFTSVSLPCSCYQCLFSGPEKVSLSRYHLAIDYKHGLPQGHSFILIYTTIKPTKETVWNMKELEKGIKTRACPISRHRLFQGRSYSIICSHMMHKEDLKNRNFIGGSNTNVCTNHFHQQTQCSSVGSALTFFGLYPQY